MANDHSPLQAYVAVLYVINPINFFWPLWGGKKDFRFASGHASGGTEL
jgi:hypothetical protein